MKNAIYLTAAMLAAPFTAQAQEWTVFESPATGQTLAMVCGEGDAPCISLYCDGGGLSMEFGVSGPGLRGHGSMIWLSIDDGDRIELPVILEGPGDNGGFSAWTPTPVSFDLLKALMAGDHVAYGLTAPGQKAVRYPLTGSAAAIGAVNSRCD